VADKEPELSAADLLAWIDGAQSAPMDTELVCECILRYTIAAARRDGSPMELATRKIIVTDTGLTPEVVRRRLDRLITAGRIVELSQTRARRYAAIPEVDP